MKSEKMAFQIWTVAVLALGSVTLMGIVYLLANL
jgi:hypothetical protein